MSNSDDSFNRMAHKYSFLSLLISARRFLEIVSLMYFLFIKTTIIRRLPMIRLASSKVLLFMMFSKETSFPNRYFPAQKENE